MSVIYPNIVIQENGVSVGGNLLPDTWLAEPAKIVSNPGFHHKVTVSFWVSEIHITSDADFLVGKAEDTF